MKIKFETQFGTVWELDSEIKTWARLEPIPMHGEYILVAPLPPKIGKTVIFICEPFEYRPGNKLPNFRLVRTAPVQKWINLDENCASN